MGAKVDAMLRDLEVVTRERKYEIESLEDVVYAEVLMLLFKERISTRFWGN